MELGTLCHVGTWNVLQKDILEGKVARGELIDEDARQRRKVIIKMSRTFVAPHLIEPASFSKFLSEFDCQLHNDFQVA